MTLCVAYKDKYRLWADVFRGGNDQFFVPTRDEILLGNTVNIQISLPDLKEPLAVHGVVIGLRPQSFRFAPGVYVRLPGPEVDKCRRVLGMAPPREPVVGRRAHRVACDLPARVVDPRLPGSLRVRNLSATGALVTGRMTIPRMPMRLEITLEGGATLTLPAQGTWMGYGAFTAGLRFDGISGEELQQLKDAVARLEAAGAGLGARRVVIADDDPAILQMLDTVLSRHGYETYRASDGEEAADLIRDLVPGLVLLDLLMPGVDGADICRMMRADVELSRVPVIFLSALDEKSMVEICEQAGASDYLMKPVALTDVLALVGRYLALEPTPAGE
jgi:CheY-like chemotaxis protein/Tfp pilus assembly protein PilZ